MLTESKMNSAELVENYVRRAYEDLRQRDQHTEHAHKQRFPCVLDLLKEIAGNSLILDIGCGDHPHLLGREDSLTIGVDVRSPARGEALASHNFAFVLADASHLPFRRDLFDAVLLVSVLHHLPDESKRRECLRQCLSVTHSQLLTVVWAREQQQNMRFAANDVLVPYNLEELAKQGHVAEIPFNNYSTREQRIVRNSVPVRVNLPPRICCPQYLPKNVQKTLLEVATRLAWLYPMMSFEFYEQRFQFAAKFLIERLAELKQLQAGPPNKNSVQDSAIVVRNFAYRFSLCALEDVYSHLRGIFRDVLRYRYYHVFDGGELEQLLDQIPAADPLLTFSVEASEYQCGNWCLRVQKTAQRKPANT